MKTAALALVACATAAGQSNPLLLPADIAALDRGEAIGRVVKAKDDGDIGLFGAVRLPQSKEAFLVWYRSEGFKQSEMIEAAGIFHNPAVPGDLDRFRFEPGELRKLQACKPGLCVSKLTDAEIAALGKDVNWAASDAVEQAAGLMRVLTADYVSGYQARGNAALGSYLDKGRPVDIWAAARTLASNFASLRELYPDLFERIEGKTRPGGGEDDFIYWSRENYGFGFKPTLSISHVIVRRAPHVVVIASKQLRASHYQDGSLGFTIVADCPGGGSYLAYASRSRFDLLRSGGWKRAIAERRLPALTKREMERMRTRLAAVK